MALRYGKDRFQGPDTRIKMTASNIFAYCVKCQVSSRMIENKCPLCKTKVVVKKNK